VFPNLFCAAIVSAERRNYPRTIGTGSADPARFPLMFERIHRCAGSIAHAATSARPAVIARNEEMVRQTASIAAASASSGDIGGGAGGISHYSVLLDGQIREAALSVDRTQDSLVVAQELARMEEEQAGLAQLRIATLDHDVAAAKAAGDLERAGPMQVELQALQDNIDSLLRMQSYRNKEILTLQDSIDRQNARLFQLRNLRHFVVSGRAVGFDPAHGAAGAVAPGVAPRHISALGAPPAPPPSDAVGPPGADAMVEHFMQSLLAAQEAAAKKETT
jgi:hypothetical protein